MKQMVSMRIIWEPKERNIPDNVGSETIKWIECECGCGDKLILEHKLIHRHQNNA